jgi:hypothetical protein
VRAAKREGQALIENREEVSRASVTRTQHSPEKFDPKPEPTPDADDVSPLELFLFRLTKDFPVPLSVLTDVERTFYRDLADASRPDVLEIDADGEPRDEADRFLMKEVWRLARESVLPIISEVEPTPEHVVRETEWILSGGKATGSGKTTVCVYYVLWFSERNPWYEKIISTVPIRAGDPFVYPFPLRDNDGKFLLHPKYRPLGALRELADAKNSLVFTDEIDNLLPGRNFEDRRQWVIVQIAKNFRKNNVTHVSSTQYIMSPDPLLRQNYQLIAVPELEKRGDDVHFKWALIPNTGPDYPEYTAWKSGVRKAAEYPSEVLLLGSGLALSGFPAVEFPWFFLFFDSAHRVPIMFQAPLDPAKVGLEAAEMKAWLEEHDSGGVWTKFFSKGEFPPSGEFNSAVRAWNIETEKMWSGEELLLIVQEFKRLFAVEEAQRPVVEEAKAEGAIPCECGRKFLSRKMFEVHVSSVQNYMSNPDSHHTAKKFEALKAQHPSLFKEAGVR